MYTLKNILYSLFFCAQTYSALAQNNACEELMKEVYTHAPKINRGKVYFIDYGVKVTERKSSAAAVENRVQMYSDSLHYYILMDKARVYVDDKISVSVVPDAKVIMINKLDDKMKKSIKKKVPNSLDSVFFASMDVVSCKDVTDNVHFNKEVEVKPKKIGEGDYNRIKYFIQEGKKEIYKVRVYFPESSSYNYADYTFYSVNYDYKEKKIDGSVYALFFNHDGNLVPGYKGYQVVDNRKNTK